MNKRIVVQRKAAANLKLRYPWAISSIKVREKGKQKGITDVRLKKDPFERYKNGGKGALDSKSVSSFFCAAESKSGDRNSSTKRSTVKAKKKVTK
jgi:hypothetical protein